jgi:hypothetical protein
MRLEPCHDGGDVRVGRTVSSAELLGRHPFVIVGGGVVLQFLLESIQGGLLIGGTRQHDPHVRELVRTGSFAAVVLGLNHGGDVAVQHNSGLLTDGTGDARGCFRSLRSRGRSAQNHAQPGRKSKQAEKPLHHDT